MNVRCPYCKKWMEDKDELIHSYVEKGKVQRVIKLFDKEKKGLQPGNIMHKYIPKKDETQALLVLKKIYETQDIWGNLNSLEEVAEYAEDQLHLKKEEQSEITNSIIEEASIANIVFVPTIVVGSHIFDENISLDELTEILEA